MSVLASHTKSGWGNRFVRKDRKLLINSCSEIYGSCPHKPVFHRYTLRNKKASTDEPKKGERGLTNKENHNNTEKEPDKETSSDEEDSVMDDENFRLTLIELSGLFFEKQHREPEEDEIYGDPAATTLDAGSADEDVGGVSTKDLSRVDKLPWL